MPERSIHKIMTATEPADVAQLAVIECLRSIADSNQKTAAVLEGVQTEVRDVRERLIRIEASRFETEVVELKTEVNELKHEVATLKLKEARQDGVVSAWDWLIKSWPNLIGFAVLIGIVLVATGKVDV